MNIKLRQFGIDRRNVGEWLEPIEQIWDSLPDQLAPDEVPEWQRAELAKRRDQAEAQPGPRKPWRGMLALFEGRS